jgi:cellulose synthase/poly-beta-1,6-N-acetylglucosamine synthase-like glycosyltransferase
MDYLTYVYLFYAFVSLYFLILFTLIYIQNKKQIYEVIKPKKEYSLSIVIPCFNAEKEIGHTIKNVLESDYNGLKKIIVVDDCSTDNSYEIIKKIAEANPKVIAVRTPKNTGNAAGAKNYGTQFVTTELIGFTDDDSMPRKEAISQMVGYFNDKRVGAVTSRVLVFQRKNLLEKLQSIEYKIIAFTRKLLGFVEAIYVTNGPLSIYRKKAFDDVGGFDKNNLTEDIEITWHFVSNGWKVCMSIPAKAYTIAPDTIKSWFKQRIRWNVGGMQTISKYKTAFLRCGMLGLFILPFFVLSWVIGTMGLFILSYRLGKYLFVKYLSVNYSIEMHTAIVNLKDISLSPSVLIFLGIIILGLGLVYNLIALVYSKEKDYESDGIFSISVYIFFYTLIYPILLITSVYKYVRGYNTW